MKLTKKDFDNLFIGFILGMDFMALMWMLSQI